MMSEKNETIPGKRKSQAPADSTLECSSMLNDMKKIDDDIKNELEKIKREGEFSTKASTTKKQSKDNRAHRQKIKIHNLDSYLKSTEMEDDSNEFYRLPTSLSSKLIATSDYKNKENLYEKLSDISTTASHFIPSKPDKQNENVEIEVEIEKETTGESKKKPNIVDFLSLNLDRYIKFEIKIFILFLYC